MKNQSGRTAITFWGTRGSIATPGRATVRYGGNTSCVEVKSGKSFLILDGGTGLRPLGSGWGKRSRQIPIFITHLHTDHIGGIPFFGPALERGVVLKIFGPPGIRKMLNHLFPFRILPSQRRIREVRRGGSRIPPFRVDWRWLNHPGGSLGYRIQNSDGKKLVYMSDHEPVRSFRHNSHLENDGVLIRWSQNADLLILDAQYFDHEYRRKRGWGHSSVTAAVSFAHQAKVKRLVLFHHDPAHSDRVLERKLRIARRELKKIGGKIACRLAREGETILL